MSATLLPIKAVVQRTGLTAHVIRIWEKRYGAVEPTRTGTNRRLYSDEQVERLALLREITQAGQSIGYVAKLPTEQLRSLLPKDQAEVRTVAPKGGASMIGRALTAIENLDAATLEGVLREGEIEFGLQGLLQKMVAPFARQIGDLWRAGSITAAHEHFATAILRAHLARTASANAPAFGAPVLVVATPTGQFHELGAMLVAASAANLGWKVTYLGASLPVAEIAGAARQQNARAVALSIIYPEDDAGLSGEIIRLSEMLAPGTAILVGGRASASYAEAIQKAGASVVSDLAALGDHLDGLRKKAAGLRVEKRE